MATLEEQLAEAQLRLYRTQVRWEPWKAVAAVIGAGAIFAGSVLAVSNWIAHQPQTINVHLDAPLTITCPIGLPGCPSPDGRTNPDRHY